MVGPLVFTQIFALSLAFAGWLEVAFGVDDPGYRIVQAAARAGVTVVPIPGPSALVAALSAAGLPTDRFAFEGFLPNRQAKRQEKLRELAAAGVDQFNVYLMNGDEREQLEHVVLEHVPGHAGALVECERIVGREEWAWMASSRVMSSYTLRRAAFISARCRTL